MASSTVPRWRIRPSPLWSSTGGQIPPRDETKQKLHAIWQQLLPGQSFGVEDDFFEIGGDLLRAVGMEMEIERVFGVNLQSGALLNGATISGTAACIRSAAASHASLVCLQSLGVGAPFYFLYSHGENLDITLLARGMGTDRPFFAVQPQAATARHSAAWRRWR